MTGRSWAALFCKVLAIYVFILVVNYTNVIGVLPAAFSQTGTWEMLAAALSFLLPFVLLAGLGVFLWVRADFISRRMVEDHPAEVRAASAEDVQAIAFTAAGVLTLSDAIPRLVQQLYSIIAISQGHLLAFEGIYNTTISGIAGSITKIIIGLWLLFGSRGIVNLLRSLRKAGLKKSQGEEI